MLDYIYGYDEGIAAFVANQIPWCRERGFSNCKAIGVSDGTRIIAGLVYHHYNPDAGTIEVSGAAIPGSRWLTRKTLKIMYQYPFIQLNCQMVIMRISDRNEPLMRLLAAKNFSFIRIPRLNGRDHDGIMCLLTREAWEENKFCKRFGHHIPDQLMERAA
jgi:RimJ/RimL family protein N-acetyltransferase